jgi:hypothetical protein
MPGLGSLLSQVSKARPGAPIVVRIDVSRNETVPRESMLAGIGSKYCVFDRGLD